MKMAHSKFREFSHEKRMVDLSSAFYVNVYLGMVMILYW